MSRTRKITTDDIIDAAERVVARLGASALSIDAVAQEAGVSKSRVVYDHKSKSGLLEAMVERHTRLETARLAEAVEASACTPHPELFGRIAATELPIDDEQKAVAIAICASSSSEEKVQKHIREWVARDIQAIEGGPRPQAALMAFLALTGFAVTEMFSFYRWEEDERKEILEAIRKVYTSFPEE